MTNKKNWRPSFTASSAFLLAWIFFFFVGLFFTKSHKISAFAAQPDSTDAAGNPDKNNGDSVIQGTYAGSNIVVTTTDRLAGAVHSIQWNAKEFIDSADHGRQLQSATNFQVDDQFIPETFNPTEAGSMFDGVGPTSTSKLHRIVAQKKHLETTIQMAFWLRPGEKSAGHLAKNRVDLSDHFVAKQLHIGYRKWPNVITLDLTFTVPEDFKFTLGQFEIITGYMPAEFKKYWKLAEEQQKLVPLSDGPGEQEFPVVFSTEDEAYAMGVWYPAGVHRKGIGFGRFRFEAEQVNKWNMVRRIANPKQQKYPRHPFQAFVILGTLREVEKTMLELQQFYTQYETWNQFETPDMPNVADKKRF